VVHSVSAALITTPCDDATADTEDDVDGRVRADLDTVDFRVDGLRRRARGLPAFERTVCGCCLRLRFFWSGSLCTRFRDDVADIGLSLKRSSIRDLDVDALGVPLPRSLYEGRPRRALGVLAALNEVGCGSLKFRRRFPLRFADFVVAVRRRCSEMSAR